ncbi:MAG: arginase family protein, partial [Planctomycetaceae bacterium]
FLVRLLNRAQQLSQHPGLLVGIGGEHSVTSALVRGICKSKGVAFSDLTVVQLDAQADLRSEHDGWRQSHLCAMRPLVELGVKLISIGLRSVQREEYEFGKQSGSVEMFLSQKLADDPQQETRLLTSLKGLTGDVYLTIDMDALEVHLCPGTGFPHPGGLGWWQVLRYLRALLHDNAQCRLVGCDIVEAVPMLGTKVNEFVAARLLTKVLAYRFSRDSAATRAD